MLADASLSLVGRVPDTLETVAAAATIGAAILVGWIYARAGAAKAWREIAEGRQVQIEERDLQATETARQHAAEIAERDTMIGELRERMARLEEQVSTLKAHDLSAVLEWGRHHEQAAAQRNSDTLLELRNATGLLGEVRDLLSTGRTPPNA